MRRVSLDEHAFSGKPACYIRVTKSPLSKMLFIVKFIQIPVDVSDPLDILFVLCINKAFKLTSRGLSHRRLEVREKHSHRFSRRRAEKGVRKL